MHRTVAQWTKLASWDENSKCQRKSETSFLNFITDVSFSLSKLLSTFYCFAYSELFHNFLLRPCCTRQRLSRSLSLMDFEMPLNTQSPAPQNKLPPGGLFVFSAP